MCGISRSPLFEFVSRGVTLTVAERACAPIIGLRYGLSLYFTRYASSIRRLDGSVDRFERHFFGDSGSRDPACPLIHAARYQREVRPLYARA